MIKTIYMLISISESNTTDTYQTCGKFMSFLTSKFLDIKSSGFSSFDFTSLSETVTLC